MKMKTYEVQDANGFVTEVEALSHIDALHKYVAEADEIVDLETKLTVSELTVDYNAPTSLDDEQVFYISAKRIDFTATRIQEHLKHLERPKLQIVEVLGDSVPCANCAIKPNDTCMYCHGYGEIHPESVDAAQEYTSELREFRDAHDTKVRY